MAFVVVFHTNRYVAREVLHLLNPLIGAPHEQTA
jgi:hypothetical protein